MNQRDAAFSHDRSVCGCSSVSPAEDDYMAMSAVLNEPGSTKKPAQ